MKFLKRKKKVKTSQKVQNPVYTAGFKSKQTQYTARKKPSRLRRLRLFKPNSGLILNIIRLVILVVLLIGFVFLLWQGIDYVISNRLSKVAGIDVVKGFVIGVESVPEYPNSVYILEDITDESAIRLFISDGRSIYTIPRDATYDDIISYYDEELPNYGWKKVNSIDRGNHDKLYGDYWVNDDTDTGLRIYNQINDVWYESLTVEEAESALSGRVDESKNRKLIISSSDGVDLLPDFPWLLRVPDSYTVRYFSTKYEDLRGVEFEEISTGNIYSFEPIAQYNGDALDNYSNVFIDIINSRNESTKLNWRIINTVEEFAPLVHIKGSIISSKSTNGYIFILNNIRTGFVYGLFQGNTDDVFSTFFLENIKDRNSEFSGDEFKFD